MRKSGREDKGYNNREGDEKSVMLNEELIYSDIRF